MSLQGYIQKVVGGSNLPWRLRYLLSITILQRLLASQDQVLEGYMGSYRLSLDLKDNIQRDIYLGFYEPIESRFLQKILRPGDLFFDVGANVGYYSLLSSQLVGRGGMVHAFEPISQNIEGLRRTIETNAISNIVTNQVAVGAQQGTLTLYSNRVEMLGNSGWASIHPGASRTVEVDVPQISLDDYVRAQGIGRVSLVKIDVEGAEMNVLRGMQTLLSRSEAPNVLCEVFPRYARDIMDFLAAFGYQFYAPTISSWVEPKEEISQMINLFCTKNPRASYDC